MKRVAFQFQVKKEDLETYKQHHKAVWPEMQAALQRNGWHNYSLFLREDGLIFGYFETPVDFQSALDGMAKEEINTRWQEFMSPFFLGDEELHPDQKMMQLEEIFHII